MKINIEHTDTFAGESNFSWINRISFEFPEGISNRTIIRKVKEWAGWTGIRCDKEIYGDFIILRPRKICEIIFIDYEW